MNTREYLVKVFFEGIMRILGPTVVSVAPEFIEKMYFQGKKRISDARTDRFLSSVEKHIKMHKALPIGLDIQSKLTFKQDGTQQRIILPVQKQIENFETIVVKASSMVKEDKEDAVIDKLPDDNWIASFCDSAKDISREEIQELWARVLAREIQNPDSVSIRTLAILKTLDTKTARLFETLCSMCFVANQKDNPLNAVVPSFSGDPGENALIDYELSFNGLNRLSDHNLIMLEYSSVAVWNSRCDLILPVMDCRQQISVTTTFFQFQGKKWALRATQQYEGDFLLRISGITLKSAGQELLSVMNVKQNDKFMEYVKTNLLSKGIEMVEVEE